MKTRSKSWILAAILCGVAPGAALPHPHVWSTLRTAIVADDKGLVSGVGIEWTFDDTYTQYALEGLDTNGDGTYQPEEIQPLTEENIKSLVESNYFTYIRQHGKLLPQGTVTQYGQDLKNGKLMLYFILPLQQAADPAAGEIEVKVYDPDFFIAFDYQETDAIRIEGTLKPGCKETLKPLPTTEELDQTRSFLADKGQDWKPEEPTDFGSMFAQALVVACG